MQPSSISIYYLLDTVSAMEYPHIRSLDAVTCNFTFIRFAEIGISGVML